METFKDLYHIEVAQVKYLTSELERLAVEYNEMQAEVIKMRGVANDAKETLTKHGKENGLLRTMITKYGSDLLKQRTQEIC